MLIVLLTLIFFNIGLGTSNEIQYDKKALSEFICKSLIWNQYWFNKWDNKTFNKLLDSKDCIVDINTSQEKSGVIYHDVFVDQLKSVLHIENSNNYLNLMYVNNYNNKDFEYYKGDFDNIFENYKITDFTKVQISINCKDVINFKPLNENKKTLIIRLFKKLITKEYIENLNDGLVASKHVNTLNICVSNSDESYPDIYYYIDSYPLIGMLKINVQNEVFWNKLYNISDEYKYLKKKLDKEGFWFIWKNGEIEYNTNKNN